MVYLLPQKISTIITPQQPRLTQRIGSINISIQLSLKGHKESRWVRKGLFDSRSLGRYVKNGRIRLALCTERLLLALVISVLFLIIASLHTGIW